MIRNLLAIVLLISLVAIYIYFDPAKQDEEYRVNEPEFVEEAEIVTGFIDIKDTIILSTNKDLLDMVCRKPVEIRIIGDCRCHYSYELVDKPQVRFILHCNPPTVDTIVPNEHCLYFIGYPHWDPAIFEKLHEKRWEVSTYYENVSEEAFYTSVRNSIRAYVTDNND